MIHNSKVSFASRLSVCDNDVFHECVLFLSVCLSLCDLFSVYVVCVVVAKYAIMLMNCEAPI